MPSILIVDDEPLARDRLRRMVEALSHYEVTGEAGSGDEALEFIERLQPDIILLDISMPGMSGMNLAKVIRAGGLSTAVIFCTAYQNQALEAFEAEAVDYLVKPVRAERLEQALEKARRYLGDRASESEEGFLRSTIGSKVMLIPVPRVICLLAEDKYTTVVHENGTTVIEDSLLELESRYPDHFFRIHRNALISRGHLRGVTRDGEGPARAILLGTDQQPEVSRRNVAALRKLLHQL